MSNDSIMSTDTNSSFGNSSSDDMCALFYERSDTSKIVYKCALIIILVFGLCANSAVISLVITVRELRNTSNVFISVICGANILMLVTFLPLQLIGHNEKTHHYIISNVETYGLSFLCCVSVYTLVLLSYERWRAVVRPVVTTAKGTGWKLAGVFILAGSLSAPNAFLYRPLDGEALGSSIDINHFDSLTFYLFVVVYAFPLGIIVVLYASLASALLSQSKMIIESVKRNPKARSRRNRVAWVTIGLVVSFAVCWSPFYLYGFLIKFVETCPPAPSLLIVFHWRTCIYMLNTCSDPLSIFLLGSRFRRHLFSCCSCLFVSRRMSRQQRYSGTSSRSTSATHLKASVSDIKLQMAGCT